MRPAFRWLFVLLILLAFGLRLHNADTFSFWTDEGLTPLRSGYSLAEILSNRIIIQQGITNDTHPPFFFLIIHFSRMVLGETDFAYRFPSLLASVLLVPLLARLGWQMQGARLGVPVAALTAINPLQIWYANEARMYTLAVLLVTAASYTLWRLIQKSRHPLRLPRRTILRHLILYIGLAALSVYTHYTAAFLIAGQGLFWLFILWRQGYRRLLASSAVVAVLVAAPLLPFTVPRFFNGYEANYSYVSPWIMLQDVVRFFALGRSVDFAAPGVIGLNVGAFLLLLLGLWRAQGGWRRPFLLVWLLAVVLGLMAGSFIKPMYQGVRHIMLGSPAFLLLLSFGLLALAEEAAKTTRTRRLAGSIGLALGLAVVVVGPLAALNNYYSGRLGKDDFRSLIQLVESRAADSDVIVYNNAILLPLHAHYQERADLAVTASPIYPLRANTSPSQLEELAQTYERIWFVTDPPADGRDAQGAVQAWLDSELLLVGSTFFDSQTVEVRVRVYDTASAELDSLPGNGRPLDIQWPNYPRLLGMAWRVAEPVTQPVIWVDLFWQGEPPAESDGLRFQLAGPDGRLGWQMVETAVDENPASWQTAALNRRSYVIPLPAGTPPGRFTVLVQPLALREVPQVLAESSAIGEVELAVSFITRPDWPNGPAQAIFANGFTLQALQLADTGVRPGHTLPLTLFWRVDSQAAVTGMQYELSLVAPDGSTLRRQVGPPGADWLSRWQPGQLLRQPSGLYLPPETPPGTYRLRLALSQGSELVRGRPFWWPVYSESVLVGQIEVLAWPLETSLPQNVTQVGAQFGQAIRLHGYDLSRKATNLELTLHWQAIATPDTNWFVFVHLVDKSGNIVAQRDLVPAEGTRPTAGWRASEVITDFHRLPLPPGLPSGEYSLRVGLFEPESFLRPTVTLNDVRQPDNQLVLTEISLP